MITRHALLSAAIFFVMPFAHSVCTASDYVMSDMEWGWDRYGADYDNFGLRTSDPTLCEEACAKRGECRAWTYVKPNTVQGPRPQCWLKNAVPQARPCSHCVSGIKIRVGEERP